MVYWSSLRTSCTRRCCLPFLWCPHAKCMKMTIVHHGSQPSESEEKKRKRKKNSETTCARGQARQAKRQYHQDRKHHNLNEWRTMLECKKNTMKTWRKREMNKMWSPGCAIYGPSAPSTASPVRIQFILCDAVARTITSACNRSSWWTIKKVSWDIHQVQERICRTFFL